MAEAARPPATKSAMSDALAFMSSSRVLACGRLGPLGARGGDEVADLFVALVAGVFEHAVAVVAAPIEAGGPGRGEDHRVGVGDLVNRRVGPGHGDALDDAG